MPVSGPAEIEELCGDRYRREVSDLDIGHGQRDMHQRLLDWGYDAAQDACRTWLATYRLLVGGIDGNASI